MDEGKLDKLIDNVPEINSSEAASQKLEKLMDENFNEFAVRFMNRGEYVEIMKNGKLPVGSEVHIFSEKNGNKVSFNEYIEESKKDWTRPIYEQTEWSHSCFDIKEANEFLDLLQQAHKEAKETPEQDDEEKIRNKTMTIFRKKLILDLRRKTNNTNLYRGADHRRDLLDNVFDLQSADRIKDKATKLLKDDGPLVVHKQMLIDVRKETDKEKRENKFNKAKKYYKENLVIGDRSLQDMEDVQKILEYAEGIEKRVMEIAKKNGTEDKTLILKDFYSNPNWLNESNDNLRSLFDSLLYLQTKDYRYDENQQYHLAVIFDLPAVVSGRADYDLYRESWGRIGNEKEDINQRRDYFLGAIALMPDKKLVEEVKELSEKSGALSHPIFSSKGSVVYPKLKK